MDDIWRMVWQEKSRTVIMLTNPTETGKVKKLQINQIEMSITYCKFLSYYISDIFHLQKKCEQYWPEPNETKDYSGIKVKFVSVESHPDFSIRTFHIQKVSILRIIVYIGF